MPKQSRVKKPSGFQGEVRQRLATLEIQYDQIIAKIAKIAQLDCDIHNAKGQCEEQADRIDTRVEVLGDTLKSQIKTLEGALTIYVDTEIKQLSARVGSDFQDQDDEIEKISRRLQSVEDKLKAKQLGEQTNVELTARVKELQRQLTEAKHEIDRLTINGTKQPTVRVLDTVQLQCGRIIDSNYVEELQELLALAQKSRDEEIMRADRVQRELNEAFEELEQLKFKAATAPTPPVLARLFDRIFGPKS